MIRKSIISKISPIDVNEEYFCRIISSMKSAEIDSRNLTYAFMHENASYPEAMSLAKFALAWAEELDSNFIKFESRATKIVKCKDTDFVNYCSRRGWSVRKTSKDIIARDKMKFKAKFELDTCIVKMIVDSCDELDKIKLLNDFIGGD